MLWAKIGGPVKIRQCLHVCLFLRTPSRTWCFSRSWVCNFVVGLWNTDYSILQHEGGMSIDPNSAKYQTLAASCGDAARYDGNRNL